MFASFSQTAVSLSALSGKAKVSQGSEFYGGAVGDSENFYSTGTIVFLIGSRLEDLFHLTHLEPGKTGTISLITEITG